MIARGLLGRACVYSRVSNPTDKRDASLESQEKAAVAHMRSLGYLVEAEDIYRERWSGKDNDRPVLTAIKDQMRDGKYRAIGFYCLDRLVRSQVHCAILFDEFDKMGVKPVSASNDIGDDTPEGKLILAIRAYLAESERIKIAERMDRGRRMRRERGQFLKLGTTRFGWNWDVTTRRRIVNPEEAAVVRQCFERVAAGWSYNQVVKDLNARGIPSPAVWRGLIKTKKDWTTTTVSEMINDPAYKGWTVMGRFTWVEVICGKTGRKRRQSRHAPEEQWVFLDKSGEITEPIVDDGLWERANAEATARINNMKASSKPRGTSKDHLLRGIAFCGKCGHKLYPVHSSGRFKKVNGEVSRYNTASYICRSRWLGYFRHHSGVTSCGTSTMRTNKIDPFVWEAFKQTVLTPGVLEAAEERLSQRTDIVAIEAELESGRRVLAEKTRLRDSLYKKWRAECEGGGDPDFADKLEADYKSMRPLIESLFQKGRRL